jgi:hypothetical protein
MALELPYDAASGVSATNAYHRIETVDYRYSDGHSRVNVSVYLTAKLAEGGADPLDSYNTYFTMNTKVNQNIAEQAYNAVKTKSIVTDSRGRNRSIDFSKAKDV